MTAMLVSQGRAAMSPVCQQTKLCILSDSLSPAVPMASRHQGSCQTAKQLCHSCQLAPVTLPLTDAGPDRTKQMMLRTNGSAAQTLHRACHQMTSHLRGANQSLGDPNGRMSA